MKAYLSYKINDGYESQIKHFCSLIFVDDNGDINVSMQNKWSELLEDREIKNVQEEKDLKEQFDFSHTMCIGTYKRRNKKDIQKWQDKLEEDRTKYLAFCEHYVNTSLGNIELAKSLLSENGYQLVDTKVNSHNILYTADDVETIEVYNLVTN